MKIALVAATKQEIEPVLEYLAERLYLKTHHNFHTVITGVGVLNTAYHLTKSLITHRPDLAIQAGVAGSFSPLIPCGSVVLVKEDIMADLGVMENNRWKDVFDLRLEDPDQFPYKNRKLCNPHHNLTDRLEMPHIKAITVNEITTSRSRIEEYTSKYTAMMESMEGAAFHSICLQEQIPFLQIRAISNEVGQRDKARWKLAEAIVNLNEELTILINKIAEQNHI